MKGIPGIKRLLQLLLAASISFTCAACAQQITPVIEVNNPPNTPAQQAKHYVVLVSLDGFRYDTTQPGMARRTSRRCHARRERSGRHVAFLSLADLPEPSLARHRSSIPSITASSPTASSIPPETTPTSTPSRRRTEMAPGTAGHPALSLAEQQGMRSACLFWPGSEAEIAGKRPSYYLEFDNKLDDKKRVEQVLAWLASAA